MILLTTKVVMETVKMLKVKRVIQILVNLIKEVVMAKKRAEKVQHQEKGPKEMDLSQA